MKSLNLFYTGASALFDFVHSHNIPDSDSVFIQVFTAINDKDFISNLTQNLAFLLPKASIIGATTAGEICDDYVSEGQTLISFTVFDSSFTKVYAVSGTDMSAKAVGNRIAKDIGRDDLKALITFTATLQEGGADYIKAFEKHSLDIPIAGGIAADDGEFSATYVFTKDRVISSGAVAVSFHGKDLKAFTDCSFGWEAMGRQMSITKAHGNKVYTIDHIPIHQLYKTYLGKDLVASLPAMGMEFPLMLQQDGVSLARFVVDVDEQGFYFSGNFEKGQTVVFGFANIEQILYEKDALAKRIARCAVASIFVYSCLARKRLLGQMCQMEIAPLSEVAPVSGFFTHSEFYHQKKQTYEMVNHTMTVIGFGESGDSVGSFTPKKSIVQTPNDRMLKALSTFISQTTKQLNIVNKELETTVYQKTSQLRKSNRDLLKRVYYDRLTGLGNRDLLLKQVESKLGQLSLILIDVNNFKDINDLYGVCSGDKILVAVAQLIQQQIENSDFTTFRVSGDEFAIVCKESVEKEQLIALIHKVDEAIKDHVFTLMLHEHEIKIYLSVTAGFAYKTQSLFEHANLALVNAKQDSVSYREYLYSLELESDVKNNIYWNNSLREAMAQDRIVPYFQPIFTNGEPNRYESLMRLIDSEGKAVSPFFFLDISKKSGDYHKLTQIMVEKTCQIFANKAQKVSINLSFEDIVDDECAEFIKERVIHYGMGSRLIIEIVESEYIKNFQKVDGFLNQMKQLGAQIAIDDFGSGYANFSYLLKLKPDYIKIDGSIIKNIDTDNDSLIIAETVTMFAKKMGIKTVGEFIHSQAVLQKALDIGIDSFQGFLLGEPKPM